MNQQLPTPSNIPGPPGLSALHQRAKQANRTYGSTGEQAQARFNAAKQLLLILGGGLATGVGARSLQGIGNVIKPARTDVMPSAQLPPVMNIHTAKEEEPGLKLAADDGSGIAHTVTKGLAGMLPTPQTPQPLMNSWGIPLGLAVGGAGVGGGYKLMDWLLQKERERSNTNELEEAEGGYQSALADQYNSAMAAKHAGDDLGIDNLADQYLEKKGFFPLIDMIPGVNMAANWPGGIDANKWDAIKGMVHAAEGATALGMGKMTYDWTKKKSRKELMQTALRKRQKERSQLSPPPLIAQVGNNAAA